MMAAVPSVSLTVRIPVDAAEALERLARDTGQSKTKIVADLIRQKDSSLRQRGDAPEEESQMTHIAETLADRLNAYEAQVPPTEHNPWEDVIYTEPFRATLDEEAIEAADPSHDSTIVVLRDGSTVSYMEAEGRWVASD